MFSTTSVCDSVLFLSACSTSTSHLAVAAPPQRNTPAPTRALSRSFGLLRLISNKILSIRHREQRRHRAFHPGQQQGPLPRMGNGLLCWCGAVSSVHLQLYVTFSAACLGVCARTYQANSAQLRHVTVFLCTLGASIICLSTRIVRLWLCRLPCRAATSGGAAAYKPQLVPGLPRPRLSQLHTA